MSRFEPSNYRASYKRTPRGLRKAKQQGEDNILPLITNPNVGIKDKRELIKIHNPFFYVFGTKLVALTDVNKLYGDEENQDEQQ